MGIDWEVKLCLMPFEPWNSTTQGPGTISLLNLRSSHQEHVEAPYWLLCTHRCKFKLFTLSQEVLSCPKMSVQFSFCPCGENSFMRQKPPPSSCLIPQPLLSSLFSTLLKAKQSAIFQLGTWGRSACTSMLWESVAPSGDISLLTTVRKWALCCTMLPIGLHLPHKGPWQDQQSTTWENDCFRIQPLTLGLLACLKLTPGHVIHFYSSKLLCSNLHR